MNTRKFPSYNIGTDINMEYFLNLLYIVKNNFSVVLLNNNKNFHIKNLCYTKRKENVCIPKMIGIVFIFC